MPNKYQGVVTKFLVKQKNWGLALFRNSGLEKLSIKIKGDIASMELRHTYEITGKLETHPKYGPIFQVNSFVPVTKDKKVNNTNQTTSAIETKFRNLNLNLRIYERLKAITLDDSHLQNLLENRFLTWGYNQKLGSAQDLDAIATSFAVVVDATERLGFWLAQFVNRIIRKTGDTYTNLQKLKQVVLAEWGHLDSKLILDGLLYAKREGWLHFADHRIYSSESWVDENDIVSHLRILKNQEAAPISVKEVKQLLVRTEIEVGKILNINNFSFDKSQKDCLKKLIKNPVLIVSGGPGSGKSTLIIGLAVLYNLLQPKAKINITTPTGRASIRLKMLVPKFNPMTLHRLLEFDENEFHRNKNNPLDAELVIIDEMSMVDNHLFATFLRASGKLQKLVLVGDINQLPPVNYGDIFHDLVTLKAFAVNYLTNNHRQLQGSGIIKLAKAIENNQVLEVEWESLRNVEFVTEESLEKLLTLKLDYSRYCERNNFDIMSYQIVAPIYKGLGGIDQINRLFQSEFNSYLKDSAKIYHQGNGNLYTISDKVLCNKNFPEYDLANGEVGIIKDLRFKDGELIGGSADFGEKIIPLNKELFKSLSLSYACSIHKTQGSEYKKVALVLNDWLQPNSFLNKKLIYTAVTRAKEELLVIGKRSTFVKFASQEAAIRSSTILEKWKT